METIAVLLTCHNRKEKTLACLSALYIAIEQVNEYEINVYLVDDGCTDGTPEAVISQFPQVNIIQGDGNLYWNRGMHLAWKRATETKEYDYYLWLNDDTYIYSDALYKIIKAAQKYQNSSIICGATEYNQNCTYSAYKQIKGIVFDKLLPNGKLQFCEVFNGNFVLIPKYVYKIVGNLDVFFRHSIGDFDYGLRANKLGISIYLLENYIGVCELGRENSIWENSKLNIFRRIKLLYSPLGDNPFYLYSYQYRHFGFLQAIKILMSTHYRVIFIKRN